jgi:4'-phosphopantetheinyl transferase
MLGRIFGDFLVRRILGLKMIEKNENGKPFSRGRKQFSVSHSGGLIVATFFHSDVGIDVECLERKINLSKIERFKMFFAESEIRFIKKSKNIRETFFLIWTLKEAIIKNFGGKLADMRRVSVFNSNLKLSSRKISFGNMNYIISAAF